MSGMFVSPTRQITPGTSLTIDEKIDVFEEATRGWQLDIAQKMADTIQHSGFAVLSVTLSYPERFWQFKNGVSSKGKSAKAFTEAMFDIFNSLQRTDPMHVAALERIYEAVRCGMYHTAGTGSGVLLSHAFQHAFAIDSAGNIQINPHLVPGEFKRHLADFVMTLRDPANTAERTNFERFFDVP